MASVRTVIHVDLDCFYCQVEELRLGLVDNPQPLAVQQWSSLIAVNYAARAKGIGRHDSVEEALKKCPELRLVHVATYLDGETEPKYHENPDKEAAKVCLDFYRRASAQIMRILGRFSPQMERASIDEAYIDVTDHKLVQAARKSTSNDLDWTGLGVVLGGTDGDGEGGAEDVQMEGGSYEDALTMNRCLNAAATLAKTIRDAVHSELGYRCSAGIADNKLLAKIGSALNKPNQQTVVLSSAVLGLMKNLSFGKIRGMGGDLGADVTAKLGATTAGELWSYSSQELQDKFGASTGQWLFNICRGVDHSLVVPRSKPQSMLAAKTFSTVYDTKQVSYWLGILAAELCVRMRDDYELHERIPKTFQVGYRTVSSGSVESRSRSCPMPQNRDDPNVLVATALALLEKANVLPCSGLSLGAQHFVDGPAKGKGSISSFFKKENPNQQQHSNSATAQTPPPKSTNTEVWKKTRNSPQSATIEKFMNFTDKSNEPDTHSRDIQPENLIFDAKSPPQDELTGVGEEIGDVIPETPPGGWVEETKIEFSDPTPSPFMRIPKPQISNPTPNSNILKRETEKQEPMGIESKGEPSESERSPKLPIMSADYENEMETNHVTDTSPALNAKETKSKHITESPESEFADPGGPIDQEDTELGVSEAREFFVVCRECGQRIDPNLTAEHEDFHFALSLQKAERSQAVAPPAGVSQSERRPTPKMAKKRSKVQSGASAKTPRLEQFFKPKS